MFLNIASSVQLANHTNVVELDYVLNLSFVFLGFIYLVFYYSLFFFIVFS